MAGTETAVPKRTRTEEQKKAKRESDRVRAKTRVNIGDAFYQWRQLREFKGMKTDQEVAFFLLKVYKSTEKRPPPFAACLSGRAEIKVEVELDNTNSWETSAEPMGASIEMEWNPNEEADSVSEDDQMGIEEHYAKSEEDDARLNNDDAESEEDEISEEDVSYHDDSDDEDYCPPIDVPAGDGLTTSVHKFRDRPTTDKKRKCHCVDTEEKLEATSSNGGDDSDVCGPINMTEIKVEPVDNQNAQIKTPPENPDQQERPRRQKVCECPTCGKVFPSNNALARHLVIHSGERPYKCFICGRGFTQRGNLKTHMKVHKGEVAEWKLIQEAPKTSYIKAHVCGHCGMDFPDRQQLEEHRESHKWPYNCSECGKSYKNEEYFKAHQRMHAGEVNFICSKCGKRWPTMSSLMTHEATHSKGEYFHCKECKKSFSRHFLLKKHLRGHMKERNYLCTVCGKGFADAHTLKVHVRVHTGERPYTCDKCGKDFYYRQGLHQHLASHDKKPKPPTKPLGRPKQLLLKVNS